MKKALLAVLLPALSLVEGLPAASFAQKIVKAPAPVLGPAPAIGALSAPQLDRLFEQRGFNGLIRPRLTAPNGAARKRPQLPHSVPPSDGRATSPIGEERSVSQFAELARRLFGNAPVVTSRKAARKALGVPGDGELDEEVRRSPRDNAERERLIQELFVQAGARREDIRAQDIGRGRHNFIVVKPGKTDRVIVVGAHHDKVSQGMGTIDNWTGATMVANLYQQLKDVETEHTYVFIAFGREEEGLIGSRAYVKALSQAELGRIDSMVNLDTLGVDGTFSWKNNSDANLLKTIRETAARERLDLTERTLTGGDADSTSFRRAGVAAVTIFGASPEIIFDIIHSETDNPTAFSLTHYVNCYKLTAAVLKTLDAQPRLF